MDSYLPARLQEIIDDFSYCEGQEKLEYLLELSEQLPTLPERLRGKRDNMEQVHECMTPVFLEAELQDGKMNFYFDVSPESPTVRGFASIMMQGVTGATPQQVLQIPHDFYLQTGLQRVLSAQRMSGMSTFLSYMKRLAAQHLTEENS
jgi:cysteine desulfuration protein SufE